MEYDDHMKFHPYEWLMKFLSKRAVTIEDRDRNYVVTKKVMSQTVTFQNEKKIYPSKLCTKPHKLIDCPTFLQMNEPDRFEAVKWIRIYSATVLMLNHFPRECKSLKNVT